MRAFFVEFLRFLATLWSRMWRWTLRKKRNFFLSLGVLIVGLVIISGVFQSVPHKPVAASTPTPTPTSTTVYTEIQAVPLHDDPQSTESASPPPTASTKTPTEPVVDRGDPESVARGFLTAYLSRPDAGWADWKDWVTAYTMPAILDQVAGQMFTTHEPLDGKTPTSVTDIRVTAPEADAERNTPIRWSHDLQVDVLGGDGSVTTITFGLVLADSDDGWTVTSVEQVAVSAK